MQNKNTLAGRSWKSRPAFRGLVIIAAMGVAVTVLAMVFDVFETFVEWAQVYEKWELLELIGSCLVVMLALGLLSFRRWQELRRVIAGREQAEQALKESEEKYRTLVETALEGINIISPDEEILFANKGFASILGYEPSELVGRNLREFVTEEQYKISQQESQKRTRGIHGRYEIEMRHRDGSYRSLLLSAAPLYDSERDYQGSLGMLMDITERKKAEEALREAQQKNQLYLQKIEKSNLILQEQRKEIEAYSHTLEKRVEERTARLNQAYQELSDKNIQLGKTLEALNRSQERLREAEKLAVIGEIGGRVAHEILNPITALLSRTQIEMDYSDVTQNALKMMKEIIADWQENLRTGKLSEYLLRKRPEKTDGTYGEEDLALLSQAVEENVDNLKRSQEFLRFFEHHIMRLVKIVDNLREMARSKRELEEVDVNSCLKEVAELFEDGLKKRNIKLTHKLSPDLPKIYVDYTELFQVFSNLLRNAMQAIESNRGGGGEVTFDSEVVGEETWVRVIDNGVGIPEENKPLIFEHGFSTKPRSEGTGLGLAISRRLVKEMGGELLLESSISEGGSTFLLKLPLTKATKIAEIDTEKATAV